MNDTDKRAQIAHALNRERNHLLHQTQPDMIAIADQLWQKIEILISQSDVRPPLTAAQEQAAQKVVHQLHDAVAGVISIAGVISVDDRQMAVRKLRDAVSAVDQLLGGGIQQQIDIGRMP